MVSVLTKRMLLITIICLSFAFPVTAGKLSPPTELTTIFSEVMEVEDAAGEQDWQKALLTVDEISELLNEISASIRSTAGESGYQNLVEEIAILRGALERNDAEAVSVALLDLEKDTFRIMNFYEYAVHPSFAVLQKYVAEAVEAAENADFKRVVHEMKEVATVMSVSAKVMGEKGIGKGMRQDFLDQLYIVLKAATDNNQQETEVALKKMELLTKAFVWIAMQ